MLTTVFALLLVLKLSGAVSIGWAYVLLPLGIGVLIVALQFVGLRVAFWLSYPQRMRRHDRARHGKDWDGWP